MKLGTWTGLLAGYKSVQEKEEARREKEDQLLKKRNELISRLRPSVAKGLQEVENTRAGLSYLKQRGLSDTAINAFGEDPERLQAAVEFARTKGADLTSEQLSDIYRVSAIDGAKPGEDVFTRLSTTEEIYRGILEGNADPEAFVDPMLMPRPRTSVIEERMPVKPEEVGVTAMQDRTWKTQEQVFDKTVLQYANTELLELQRKIDEGAALAPEENDRRVALIEDITKYSEGDLDALTRLRETYRPQAIEIIKRQENLPAGFLAGLENNPLIFDFGQEARQAVEQRLQSAPEGGVLIAQGVDPADNRMTKFYRMPDGSVIPVKE